MTKEELNQIIHEFESVAMNAVGHVARANYAEREREAKGWVRAARATALAKIDGGWVRP